MNVTKQEAESFIYKVKQSAIKLKWLMFYADTTVDNLEYAMKRYCIYDNAVTFYSALYQWLQDGIISPENAFNEAFERSQKVLKSY